MLGIIFDLRGERNGYGDGDLYGESCECAIAVVDTCAVTMNMRKLAIFVMVFLPICLGAQDVRYANIVLTSGGFPYATIRVCTEPASGTPCTPLATNIYSDPGGTQPLSNPFTSDVNGNFNFFGNPTTTYHVQVSGTGLVTYDIPYITLSGAGQPLQVNGTSISAGDVVNLNGSTPAAPANGLNVIWQESTSGATANVSAAVVGDGVSTDCLLGTGIFSACPGSSSGVTGSGASGQVAYWNGTSTLTGSTTFTFSTVSADATLFMGQNNTTQGRVELFGSSSGSGNILLAGPGPYGSITGLNTPNSTLAFGASPFIMVGKATEFDPASISAISSTSNIVSVTCTCDFPSGVYVNISSVTDATFDGNYLITSVTSGGTGTEVFTYGLSGSNRSSSGGYAQLYTAGSAYYGSTGSNVLGSPGLFLYAPAGTTVGNAPIGINLIVGAVTSNGLAGGPINLIAGDSANGSEAAGSINLTAGSGINSSAVINGGSINLNLGAPTGGGTAGVMGLGSGATVASLPAASTVPGSVAYVTDSTSISAEGQTCAGSSSNKALAFSNGTVWKCF
jgi:hypothetical protein